MLISQASGGLVGVTVSLCFLGLRIFLWVRRARKYSKPAAARPPNGQGFYPQQPIGPGSQYPGSFRQQPPNPQYPNPQYPNPQQPPQFQPYPGHFQPAQQAPYPQQQPPYPQYAPQGQFYPLHPLNGERESGELFGNRPQGPQSQL